MPVERIHVLAGDKVELACDVSSWSDDEEGRFHYDQGSATLAPGFGSRSIHRQPAIKNNNKAGPSSSSSSRQRHYSGTWGHHGRLKRRYDHHDDGGEHDEEEKEGGYLVLWFIDPERKPFYRYNSRCHGFMKRTFLHVCWWYLELSIGQRFTSEVVNFVVHWPDGKTINQEHADYQHHR